MQIATKALATTALVGAVALGGCGGSSSNSSSAHQSSSPFSSSSTSTNASQGTSSWPQAEQTAFMNSCDKSSGGKVAYCRCALDKISASIPAQQTVGISASDPRVQRAIETCLNGGTPVTSGWPAAERTAFMNACDKTSGGRVAYCRCALDKISVTVPATKAGSVTVNDPRVQSAIHACLGK